MGKDGGSAPAAPDYTALANQTANIQARLLRQQTEANRVNQFTPYGSLTWTHNPNRTFDQRGFDAAMQNYTNQLNAYTNAGMQGVSDPFFDPFSLATPDMRNGASSGTGLAAPVMPDRESFYSGSQDGGWAATVNLSPDQQAILDAQERASLSALGAANSLLENYDPSLNLGALPSTRINPGETYTDAAMRLMQPTWDKQMDAERTRLANSGITLGSDAYSAGMRDTNDAISRAQLQATMLGLDKDQTARANALNEQIAVGNYTPNVLAALRSGSQVSNPGFAAVPQQGLAQAPDLMGAAQNAYNAQMNQYNAGVASDNAMMGGLFSLGSAVLGGPMGGLFGLGGGVPSAASVIL